MCAALLPNELLYSGVIGSRRGLKGVKPSCLQRRINYDSDRMLITEDFLPLPLFTFRSHESPLSIVDFAVFNKCGLQTTIRSGFLCHTRGLSYSHAHNIKKAPYG